MGDLLAQAPQMTPPHSIREQRVMAKDKTDVPRWLSHHRGVISPSMPESSFFLGVSFF